MLHALALLLPRFLRRLACLAIGHAWFPLSVAESDARGFRRERRAVVTLVIRCNLCELRGTARCLAGPVR